jgi:hypothetical protein
MDRKKELKMLAREMKPIAGIFQIKNTFNKKVLIESTQDLKMMNRRKFELDAGMHPNKALQAEWKQFGADSFIFEILETIPQKKEEETDIGEILLELQKKWLKMLQPLEDGGYHRHSEYQNNQ